MGKHGGSLQQGKEGARRKPAAAALPRGREKGAQLLGGAPAARAEGGWPAPGPQLDSRRGGGLGCDGRAGESARQPARAPAKLPLLTPRALAQQGLPQRLSQAPSTVHRPLMPAPLCPPLYSCLSRKPPVEG